MGLISTIGKKIASTGKKLGLKDYGITEAFGGNKTSTNYQKAISGNNMLLKATATPTKSPSTSTTTKKDSGNVLGAKTSSSSGSTGSSTASTVSSYATQRAKDEARSSSKSGDIKSLYSDESKKIAEAEKRAEQERQKYLSLYDTAQNNLYNSLVGLESPESAYNRFSTEEGLTEAQGVSKGLREQLDRVNKLMKGTEESVGARSMQSGLTEAQRQRLVESELDPLREQYADISTGLTGATANEAQVRQNIADRLSAFTSGQETSLEPLRQAVTAAGAKIDFMLPEISDKLSRDITQYSNERQSRLDGLLAKYDRQEALDDAELIEMSQIAKEERQYIQTQQQFTDLLSSVSQPTTTTSNVQDVYTPQTQALETLWGSSFGMVPSSTGFLYQ